MSVSLTTETQRLIEEGMKRCGYGSPDDLVRAAIQTLDDAQREPARGGDITAAQLREKVEIGMRQSRAGRLHDGDAFFDELEREG